MNEEVSKRVVEPRTPERVVMLGSAVKIRGGVRKGQPPRYKQKRFIHVSRNYRQQPNPDKIMAQIQPFLYYPERGKTRMVRRSDETIAEFEQRVTQKLALQDLMHNPHKKNRG